MTSVLNVDTIAAKDGTSPVGLTKQEATKHYVNYDAIDQATDSSLNQSSLNDQGAGTFSSSFTNNFSSGTNKVHHADSFNTNDGGSTIVSGGVRGGSGANIGATSGVSTAALSTSSVQFSTTFGASSSASGGVADYSGSFCSSIGDLA